MSPSPRSPAFEQLAEHVDFVTRLARSLIADEQLAADAAQATFVAALSLPPRRDDNPRAWLATVLRRTVSRIRRSSRRRATREQAVAALAADSATSVVDTVARVAAHRDLANLVLALDEPYRSTVTLRYFDGLSIDEVARATGVPKNTARSRLSRGLARLRAALDGQYGDRAAWAAVVLPLARRSLTVGKAAPAVFAGVLVKKLILAAAAAVLCISVWQFGFAGGGTPAAPPVAGALGSAIPPADLRAAADPPDAAPDRLVAAAPDATSVDAEAANRRLVDVALEPLVGLRMRRESAATVRWQGGDTGWISGPGESLQLAETEIERLRRDPAFATEFFAARRQPEQWRAAILGEPLPDAEVVTDGSGAFAFDVPVAIADVALVEPGWTLVARPRGEVGSFVGTRAVRVCGRLVDPQGGPIGGGFVTVDVAGALPAALGDLAAVDVPEMRSSRDGGFVVRRAPSAPGVVLKARAPGRQTAIVAMPAGDTAVDEFEIRLWPLGDEQRLLVEGVVVDRSQAPVEALVAVGDA
ncbi:MAG: RNA polymerase sigma factor, partial [Planctomycetes bacterium]|nr:RNA polymerase sigma factor [Planctomycetota bacterium]